MSFTGQTANGRRITIDKKVLLDELRKNRVIHAEEFEAAKVEYMEYLQTELKNALKLVKKSPFEKLTNFKLLPEAPVSHLADIDEVIEMLEYSTEDTIEIDTAAFRAYVKNEWSWTAQFKSVLESYKSVGSSLA